MIFWCVPGPKSPHFLSNAVHMQTPLSLQMSKMCWICLISSIKRKWGPSPHHCRAQPDEAHLHTLNLKHQWNSSDAFSSATCLYSLMDHIYNDHSVNTALPATLHRAFFFGWGNPAWFKVHQSKWRDSALSTGSRWSEARAGNSEET